MSNVIGTIIIVIGLLFNLFGCIGLVRLPDVYNRLQAATKCVTLGTCLVLLGIIIFPCIGCVGIDFKVMLCIIFILITSPTAAHALARGAHASGVKLWKKSVVDKFAEAKEPGVTDKEQE